MRLLFETIHLRRFIIDFIRHGEKELHKINENLPILTICWDFQHEIKMKISKLIPFNSFIFFDFTKLFQMLKKFNFFLFETRNNTIKNNLIHLIWHTWCSIAQILNGYAVAITWTSEWFIRMASIWNETNNWTLFHDLCANAIITLLIKTEKSIKSISRNYNIFQLEFKVQSPKLLKYQSLMKLVSK